MRRLTICMAIALGAIWLSGGAVTSVVPALHRADAGQSGAVNDAPLLRTISSAGLAASHLQAIERQALRQTDAKPVAAAVTLATPAPVISAPARADIKAAIQTELKRLGCYRGPSDNIWGAMSRRALQRFNQAAGAALEADAPDQAALAAIQTFADKFCQRAACHAGGGGVKPECLKQGAAAVASAAVKADEGESGNDTYLPPWMRNRKIAAVETGVISDALDGAAAQRALQKAPRKRRAARSAASSAQRGPRRSRRSEFNFPWPWQ